MVPVLIRIPELDYDLYKTLAFEAGVSVAEYTRDALKKKAGVKKKKKKYSIWDLGTKFVIRGGPKDASKNFDKYLWEAKENKIRSFSENT